MGRPRTGPGLVLRCAEVMIRAACRLLPDGERADREAEWSAEAEAVAGDTRIRPSALRAVKLLLFAASLLAHARAVRGTRATTVSAERPAGRPRRTTDSLLHVLSGFATSVITGGGVAADSYVEGNVAGIVLGLVAGVIGIVTRVMHTSGMRGSEGVVGVVGRMAPDWPWWASLLVVLAWLLLYTCRLVARYRLLSKALDKVPPERVADVAAFIDGGQVVPRGRGSAREASVSGSRSGGPGAEDR